MQRVFIKRTDSTLKIFRAAFFGNGLIANLIRYDGENAIVDVRDLDGIYDEYCIPREDIELEEGTAR